MKFLLGCVAVLALQWALVSRATIGLAAADLPLAFLLYAALRGLPGTLPFGAWALGLAVDLLGTYPAGLHALAFLLIGTAAKAAAGAAAPRSLPLGLAALACGSVFLKTAQAFALAADGAVLPAGMWFRTVSVSSVLTAVVGTALFLGLDLLSGPARGGAPSGESPAGVFSAPRAAAPGLSGTAAGEPA
ncbi:MAG: hypothetical protein MUC63_06935 [Planctomycetes bacterium]|jgi:hypothetical protein|nr:hypothetical protein [Planctomycetota bacterium]